MKAVALVDDPKVGVVQSHVYDITPIGDNVVSVKTKLGTTLMFSKNFKTIDNDRKTISRNRIITCFFKWIKNLKG